MESPDDLPPGKPAASESWYSPCFFVLIWLEFLHKSARGAFLRCGTFAVCIPGIYDIHCSTSQQTPRLLPVKI